MKKVKKTKKVVEEAEVEVKKVKKSKKVAEETADEEPAKKKSKKDKKVSAFFTCFRFRLTRVLLIVYALFDLIIFNFCCTKTYSILC